ncbi:hypothetical protein BRADI_1g74877v3, partial [Brachypodium distachyon]
RLDYGLVHVHRRRCRHASAAVGARRPHGRRRRSRRAVPAVHHAVAWPVAHARHAPPSGAPDRRLLAPPGHVHAGRAHPRHLLPPGRRRRRRPQLARRPPPPQQGPEKAPVPRRPGPPARPTQDEVDIVAKFLYNKPRRIVCELCRHGGFARIDILCSNIRLMQACFDHARFDTLKIHVKSSSHRYRAERAPPGRHRRWERCTDFTPKTFCLQFEKGTLERCYGKMLYTDPPLILLTLSPPPGQEEEEAQATDTQIFTAHPVLPPFASTNTGATFVMHEYGDEDA